MGAREDNSNRPGGLAYQGTLTATPPYLGQTHLEYAMAHKSDDHAGSGLDKSDPKSILEKVGDSLKAVLPKNADKPAEEISLTGIGNGTAQDIPK
jgi:hypothetical protein